jgi:hypothetical protein
MLEDQHEATKKHGSGVKALHAVGNHCMEYLTNLQRKWETIC